MRVDWSFVKPLYCAGGLSNCEIVKQYNAAHENQGEWRPTVTEAAIRKQARKEGWQKTIADQVKKKVREKLVRGEFEPRTSDEEIIEQAAESIAGLMQLHRKDIGQLKTLEADLLRRLREDESQVELVKYQGVAYEHLIKLGLDQRVGVYLKLVQAIGLRIRLERLAWSIDDDTDPNAVKRVEVYQEF
jgi:hypothetical protein